MKRWLLSAMLVMALALCGYSLRAQTMTIGFDQTTGFIGLQDTVYAGAQFPFGGLVKNNSDTAVFSDSLIISGLIDTGSGYVHLPPTPIPNTVIQPHDSVLILIPGDFRDNYQGGLFRIGGNVIVVWPAIVGSSSSFNTGDSLTATVFIIDTINSTGSSMSPDEQVRCYPVPAQGLLYITSASPSYHVKEATVYDLTGRLIAYSKETSAGIDTESWLPGVYILDVTFDNGTRRIYKIARR
ncbi:MAG TPA: T9SS type A sorting domain-containing protein [Bacteroidia bacterium]|nr:T9SS type A sorting domain-containing protein [Bacteroidia bacterium]